MPRSSDETLRKILNAANRIVLEQGVDRLTLEATAREAGISKGGLLYHFPSKEALISGMIQSYLERFTADLNEAAEHAEAAAGRWTRAYLETTFSDNQRSPRLNASLLAAIATNPSLLAPIQARFQEWIELLEVDGIEPVTTAIIRLAADGLWLVELFGLAPPNAELKGKVLEALGNISKRNTIR